MQQATLHTLPLGTYVWVYRAEYGGAITTSLGRVIDHPDGMTKFSIIEVPQHGDLVVKELVVNEETKSHRYAPCSDFEAESWLQTNAVESKMKKLIAEKEVSFRTALGFQNLYATMVGAPQASLVTVTQASEYDEVPGEPDDSELPAPLNDEIPF